MQSGGAFFERELSRAQEILARAAGVLILIGVGALAPFILRSFQGLKLSSGNIEAWMPVGTPERAVYDRFSGIFETHDALLISWEGAGGMDPRLLEVASAIEDLDRQQAEDRQQPRLTAKVSTLPGVLDSFAGSVQDMEGFAARIEEAVSGYLTGKDGEPGIVVVESTEHGLRHRLETFRLAREAAESVVPDAPGGLRYTGPCYMGVCANEETEKTLLLVTPLTAAISLLVAFLFLRSFPLALLSFASSGLSAAVIISIIHLSGRPLGEMLAVIPSLAQLTAMCGGVHLINYYAEFALHQNDYRRAWLYAVHSGWAPTFAASLTTAIGFGSLYASDLPVVRDFAIFGVIGVGCSFVIVLLVIPSVLVLLRPRVLPPWRAQTGLIEGLFKLTARRTGIVSVLLLGTFFAAIAGLPRLKPDILMEDFFAADSPFRRDFEWFEQRLGPLQSSDVMVTFKGEARETDLAAQFNFVERLTERIRSADPAYAVFSPSLFREGVARKYRDEETVLDGVLDHVQEEGWAWADAQGDHWRIALRHPAESNPADSDLMRHIDSISTDLLSYWDDGSKPPVVELTGIARLFGKAQSGLLRQLLISFFLAFLIITPVLMISLGSVKLGLIAILPNIFPLGILFGTLGWMGVGVDVATMMIASVAFGIAVDDTVHFLTWMERGLAVEHTVSRSVGFALRNSGGAMVQVTLILSLGMMAFLISDFKPSVRFAMFSAAALCIALVGDLILLPALLQGPFRRIFRHFRGNLNFVD